MQTSKLSSQTGRLGRLDAVAVGLVAALFLLTSYLRSRNTMFWSDEIMGWLVLHEHGVRGLFHSWWGGADSSGIFFYLLGIPWLHAFGDREIALRLFSAAGIATAFGLTWATARRFYSFETVVTCLPAVFILSGTVPWQLANGRTYGVFLAAVALTGYALVAVAPPRRLGPGLLALTALAHLVLLGSHVLGPLCSAVFLAALLLQDVWSRVWRPKLYLAAALPWLSLALYLPNLRATAALGKPVFWTVKPHLGELLLAATSFSEPIARAVKLLVTVGIAAYFARRREERPPLLTDPDRKPIVVLLGSFLLLEAAMFAISQITTSIFVDRYLLPMVIADAILCCEALSRARQLLRVPAILWTALACVMVVISAGGLRAIAHNRSFYPETPYPARLLEMLPKNLPVIDTNLGSFVEVNHYEHTRVNLLTPVDWPLFLEQAEDGISVSGAHEMDNWKKLGYYADRIQPTEKLLAENRDFVVITSSVDTLWLDRRVRSNPKYDVQHLGSLTTRLAILEIWKVQTRG